MRTWTVLASLSALLWTPACFDEGSGDGSGTDGSGGTGTSDSAGTSSGSATTNTTSGTDSASGTSTTASTTSDSASGSSTTTTDGTSGSTGGAGCEVDQDCLDAAPDGWTGPVAVATSTDPNELPDCTGDWDGEVAEFHANPMGEAASCSSCACGTPSGVECAPPSVEFWGNSNCFGDAAFTAALKPDGQCTVFNQPAGGYGGASDPVDAVPNTGSCAPSGGEPGVVDPTWGDTIRACALVDAVDLCETGECVPPAPADFETGRCIYRDGDVSCPPGDYINRTVWYTDINDTRGCTDCACTSPAGAQCQAEINFHFNATCSDAYVDIVSPGQECVTLWGQAPGSAVFNVSGTVGGSCAPSGGEADGDVEAAGPTTFCCTG